MRRLSFLILLLLVVSPVWAFQIDSNPDEETTLIFVRHAERDEDGTRNPPISEQGLFRAQNLASVLDGMNLNVSIIYSTPYKRTMMTAAPSAEVFDLEILEYGFDNLENWLTSVIDSNTGKTVLIVGHSNTTPRLINLVLGEETFEQLDEHAYGDLFIVKTSEYGSGTVELSSF